MCVYVRGLTELPNESTLPLRQLREMQTVHAEALRELAACALRSGQFSLSRDRLLLAVKANPFHLPSWRELADMELKINGIEAMRKTYDSAVDALPKGLHAKVYHWYVLDEQNPPKKQSPLLPPNTQTPQQQMYR